MYYKYRFGLTSLFMLLWTKIGERVTLKYQILVIFQNILTQAIISHTKVVDQKFWVQKKADSPFFQNKLL